MYKPLVRSPRSIAEEKNGSELFQGEGNYNAEAGVPAGVSDGNAARGEDRYRANPTNQPEPPAPWAKKQG
jgi:hypothetical protein